MNEIYVYIRECTNGLQTIYQDANATNIGEDNLNLINFDERSTTVQFAPRSQYYSIQATPNHLVYSLMDSSVTDNFGRSGYTGIYLICKNKYTSIDNFIDILQRLMERYNHFKEMGQLHAQNYADILNDSRIESRPSYHLTLRDTKNYYLRFNAGDSGKIEEYFHSEVPYVLGKIYAFENNEQVYDDQAAQSLGLTPLTNKNVATTQFNFDPFYLTELWINGKNYSSSLRGTSLQIISKDQLEIKGKVRDKKELISIRNNSNILPPPPPPKQVKQVSNSQKQQPIYASRKKNNTMYILLALGVLVGAFFGRTYIAKIGPFKEEPVAEEQTVVTNNNVTTSSDSTDNKAPFITATTTDKGNTYYVTTEIKSLNEWYINYDTTSHKLNVYKSLSNFTEKKDLIEIDDEEKFKTILSEIEPEDWKQFKDSLKTIHKVKIVFKPKPKASGSTSSGSQSNNENFYQKEEAPTFK